MKRIIAFALSIITIVCCISSCAQNDQTREVLPVETTKEETQKSAETTLIETIENENPVETTKDEKSESTTLGDWEYPEYPDVTFEVKETIRDAMGDMLGVGMIPVAHIAYKWSLEKGQQLILCETYAVMPDAKKYLSLVTVDEEYIPVGEITPAVTTKRKITSRKSLGSDIVFADNLPGSWQLNDSPRLTAESRKIFNDAEMNLDGIKLTPLAFVATQLVDGMNYLYICRKESILKVDNDRESLCAVVVYKDFQDNVKITKIDTFLTYSVSNVTE